MACLGRSGLPCALCAQPPPSPPLCPARHLGAPRCSLCERALRLLYMRWAIEGVYASACAMAGPSVAWLARSGLPRVLARVRPPPHCPARRVAAPRYSLCACALRPLYMWWAIGGLFASACAMAGPSVAWLARSGLPRVLARVRPLPSAARRRASVLPVCVRSAPAVHVVGYRGSFCVSLHNGRA